MRKQRRLSDEAAEVMALFLDNPGQERYGLEIIKLSGIKSGSLYPILHRFERQDLVAARWESSEDAARERRRPRRAYRLKEGEVQRARQLHEDWANTRKPASPAPRVRPTPRLGNAT